MSKIVKNILFYRLKSQFIYYIILFYNTLNLSDFIFRIQPIKITSTKKEKKKKKAHDQSLLQQLEKHRHHHHCKPNDNNVIWF